VTGRTTKRAPKSSSHDELPSLRQRSPAAFWVAVIVLVGMVASVLTGVIIGLAS
jgi:hypothetical protein